MKNKVDSMNRIEKIKMRCALAATKGQKLRAKGQNPNRSVLQRLLVQEKLVELEQSVELDQLVSGTIR